MFSQVKKNESALERIKGYQGEMQIYPRKMKVCQIERTKKTKNKKQLNESQYNSKKKISKKKKEEEKLARLKTRKGGLGKN